MPFWRENSNETFLLISKHCDPSQVFFFRFAEVWILHFAIAVAEPKITSNTEKSAEDFALLKSLREKQPDPVKLTNNII